MPRKAKRPCCHPGCSSLTEERYCKEHKPLHNVRPSASSLGYGNKWRNTSKQYLRAHPLCVRCSLEGKYTQATVVDHIIPHRGDKLLFWDNTNWQSLCKPCHDRKTWKEDSNPEYKY